MDILGFLAVLAALFAAPRLGLDDAALRIFHRARARGVVTYQEARNWFLIHAWLPTQWLLGISALIQFCVTALAMYVDWDKLSTSLSWLAVIATMSVVAQILFILYQYPSRPRFRQVPVDPANPDGQKTDELDGNGSPVIDETNTATDRYLPGRFSFTRSLGLVLLSHAMIAGLLMWVGVQNTSTRLFTLGAFCLYFVIIIVGMFAGFIAWLLEKGASLLEFIATVVSKEVLVALPGFKWSNIEQHLSEINILEQERYAAALRSFAPSLALHLTPFVAVVWMWTNPTVASAAISLLFVSALTAWYLTKNGGAQEVANRRYQFARLMFYALPAVCALGFIAGLIPEDVKNVFEGQRANLQSAVVGYGNGRKSVAIDGPWQNLGAGFVWFLLMGTTGAIAWFLSPEERSGRVRRWMFNAFSALTVFCMLAMVWRGYGLVMNISGEKTLGLPRVVTEKTDAPPPVPTNAKTGATPAPSSSAKSEAEPSDKTPTPTPSGSKPGKRKSKPDSRAVHSATGTDRGELLPEFVTEYRRVVGQDP